MKPRKFLVIAMLYLCYSCNNIGNLNHQKVRFKDLPSEVAVYLKNPTDYQDVMQNRILEIPIVTEKEYRLETVKTWIGPWVSHHKMISKKTGKIYKIDQGVPSPYIVYKKRLYIPDEYNIFTGVEDIESVEFTQYDLE